MDYNYPWHYPQNIYYRRFAYFWVDSAENNYKITVASETGWVDGSCNKSKSIFVTRICSKLLIPLAGTWFNSRLNQSTFTSEAGSLPTACAAGSYTGPGWYSGCNSVWEWDTWTNGAVRANMELKIRNSLAQWSTTRTDVVALIEKLKSK